MSFPHLFSLLTYIMSAKDPFRCIMVFLSFLVTKDIERKGKYVPPLQGLWYILFMDYGK